MLPVIAATPPSHDENPITVGEVEKLIGLQLPFEANLVQPQIANVAEFVFHAFGVDAEKHVGRPSAAANQNVLVIDMEEFIAVLIFVCRDLANTELGAR